MSGRTPFVFMLNLALAFSLLAPQASSAPHSHPLLLALELAASDDEAAVKDYEKYYRKLDDVPARVEAVLTLLDNESPKVVDALLPRLADDEEEIATAARRVLSGFETRPPVDRLLQKFEREKKEELRIGMLRALRDGGYGDLGEAVLEGLEDRSWAVRRESLLALGASGDASLAPSFVPLAEDDEPAVRSAAIQALTSLRSPEVVPVAHGALDDDTWQVRASAIEALGFVRRRESIPVLIARFDVEEGRLIADIGKALDRITGRGLGARVERWKSFWNSLGDRFEIPSDAELEKIEAAKKENAARYAPPGSASFHGVETPSRSILFVIDISGSMEDLVVERGRFADGEYPSWARMDIVKTELARTIEGLEPYVEFGILAFATDMKRWKKKLVPANAINRESALDFVRKLEPLGGGSKVALADAGLVGAANLEAGKTNTYGALATALGMEDAGKYSKEEYLSDVDTVFFLSDGRPTHGKYIDTRDILARVKAANELRKVVLHTIAIGNFDKSFMEQLALDNDGAFVDLGK